MTTYGYTLSSEEHHPNDLVQAAREAEHLGFDQRGCFKFWETELVPALGVAGRG